MKYNRLNLGQIEALLNKVGGTTGLNRILSGRTVTRDILANESNFTVWKTLRIESLINPKVKITPTAQNMMSQKGFRTISCPQDMDLVLVSTDELGVTEEYNSSDVCVRAKELGLEPCPPELGTQLVIQETGIERLLVGMKPIYHPPSNHSFVFLLREVTLDGANENTGDFGPGLNTMWVFIKPRK
jgi:hypothetical protein